MDNEQILPSRFRATWRVPIGVDQSKRITRFLADHSRLFISNEDVEKLGIIRVSMGTGCETIIEQIRNPTHKS